MTVPLFYFLMIGIILGLSAGLAPGPLLALVISETLSHDIKAGVKVAIAPLITDVLLILLTFFILTRLSAFHTLLGIISLTGGCVILFMGWEALRSKGFKPDVQIRPPASLTKGILANALNPHPYLFWFSVGAPMMIKALQVNLLTLTAFIGGFYTMLVGSKILIAFLVGRSKSFLSGGAYVYALRFFGLVLCIFSIFLFCDGLKLLGWA